MTKTTTKFGFAGVSFALLAVASSGLLGCGAEPEEASGVDVELALATPPPELTAFATMVRNASNGARAAGSKSCGVAITPVQVSTATIDKAIQTFVTNYRNVKVTASPQSACGTPGKAVCSSLFQNIVFHNDGRMGTALHPSAQRVDSQASGERVTIYTSAKPVVATTAGIFGGWLMGVAWFDNQPSCP